MKYELVGVKPYDFMKDNERVVGVNLFIVDREPDAKNVVGYEVLKLSLSQEKMERFLSGRSYDDVINTEVMITYNRYGRPDAVVTV